jgi:hypothetical protein
VGSHATLDLFAPDHHRAPSPRSAAAVHDRYELVRHPSATGEGRSGPDGSHRDTEIVRRDDLPHSGCASHLPCGDGRGWSRSRVSPAEHRSIRKRGIGDGTLELVFERFTDRSRRVLVLAQEEARLLNHSFIGTEHILLGIIQERDGIGAQALRSLGIYFEAARQRVVETIGIAGTVQSGSPPFTPRAKKTLELSLREALQMNHNYIGTEHLLLGLVREGDGVAVTVLTAMGADPARVRQEVIRLISSAGEPLGAVSAHGQDMPDTVGISSPWEPCCPRCRRPVSETARFRTIEVLPDNEDEDPLSLTIVYCRLCGTALPVIESGGSS